MYFEHELVNSQKMLFTILDIGVGKTQFSIFLATRCQCYEPFFCHLRLSRI